MALSGRQGRGRGGEAQGTEGGDVRDGKEATAETGAEEDTTWERMSVMAAGAKLPTAYGQEESRDGTHRR